MARFVLVAMMMFAAVNAQTACDMDAFSAIMQKVSTDCTAEARCSAACQGDINSILNTPAITACFAGQESSLQALEQYKAACGGSKSSASTVGVAAVSAVAAAALLL
jgi:hypothetical protein